MNDDHQGNRSLASRLLRASGRWLGLFCVGLVAAAAWFAALPVLGNPWSIEWVVFAAAVSIAWGWLLTAVWNPASFGARIGLTVAAGLPFVFLVAGIVINPVVVGGVVYGQNSDTYRQVTYANGLVADLETLGAMDQYLTGSTASAWSSSPEILKAQVRCEEISNKYSDALKDKTVPAAELLPATNSTMSAAFEMGQALELRLKLLESGSTEGTEVLDARRATFSQQWQQAGQELGAGAQQLNIPLNTTEGPTES